MLAGLPFVRSVERSGSTFQITLSDEESIKPLMDCLGGADIRRICLKEPSLEEVFISLTGEKLRE
jgi:ABC-2 type transport system ATP-binding protein